MRELPVLLELNLNEPEKFGNVAEMLKVQERRALAIDLIELIKIDEISMGPWLSKAKGYLEKVQEEADDASNSSEQQGTDEQPPPKTDMVLSAVIQFAAGATDALLGEPDLARASEPGGEQLASWVSSQLRTQDKNWTLDTDPLVIHMSVTGLSWRKRDFDDDDRVFHSHFLPCTEVVINANAKSVERAPRITHDFFRYPYEIDRSISRGKWVDYEPVHNEADPQAPKNFYEVDLWIDLDGDDIDEPWTVVISRDDMPEVVRIRPRWSKKTVVDTAEKLYFNPIHRFYPYRLLPSADGSFLPMGFGRILDRAQSSADNLLGSITDTAKSEAENGGVFGGGAGFGMPDSIELKNNRITVIPTDGAPLAGRFQAFPVKTVSPGSVQILDKILTLADRLSGTLNLMQNAPASMTATLAKGIIDTGTKVQSAVHRRLVQSMTQEFREFVQMADAYDMLPEGVTKSDGGGVAVTADPQLATEMQRSGLAGVYMEMMKQALEGIPWNMQKLQLRLTQVLRLPNPEELIGPPPKTPEATPVEKMQGALDMMKQKTDQMKAKGLVAVQITQALKNLVDAGGGMIDQRAALLQMAQLEDVVQQLTQSAGNDPTGMAQQPGNPNVAGGTPQPQDGSPAPVPGGAAGGPGDAGAGGGIS